MQYLRPARYTKRLLYNEIENFREYLGITSSNYPLDVKALSSSGGLTIANRDFKTHGLKGMLSIVNQHGYVLLDSKSSAYEQNFFCGHEVIHFVLHRNIGTNSFQCFDKVNRNNIVEWQANEGAAEFIVPYRKFIPDVLSLLNPITRTGDYFEAVFLLSEKYHVSEMVIRNRLDGLRFEIYQVANGTPLNEIMILSKRQQERQGIAVPSCCEIELRGYFSDMA